MGDSLAAGHGHLITACYSSLEFLSVKTMETPERELKSGEQEVLGTGDKPAPTCGKEELHGSGPLSPPKNGGPGKPPLHGGRKWKFSHSPALTLGSNLGPFMCLEGLAPLSYL